MNQQTYLYREALFICLVAFILFLFGHDGREFIHGEITTVVMAQEMLNNGITIFPTLWGEAIYPDFPAGQIILIYLASLPFGEVTIYSAVIPNALAASLTLALIFLIGASHSRQWGIYAVLIALFTVGFILLTRNLSVDLFVTALTTASFYLVHKAYKDNNSWPLLLLPICLLAGLLLRGPIGLIIPAGVVASYYLVKNDIKSLLLITVTAILLLIIGSAALLYAAYLQGGPEFLQTVLTSTSSVLPASSQATPVYYYFVEGSGLYAVSFPLALLVIIAKSKRLINNADNVDMQLLRLITAWAVVLLIGMSIPGAKKLSYVLPIIPAVSLIAAYLFIDRSSSVLIRYPRYLFLKLSTFLPLISIGLMLILINHPKLTDNEIPPYMFSLGLLFFTIFIVSFSLQLKDRLRQQRQYIQLATGVITVLIAIIFVAQPVEVSLNSVKPFINNLRFHSQMEQRPIIFYEINPTEQGLKVVSNFNKSLHDQISLDNFIEGNENLSTLTQPYYLVIFKEQYEQLPNNLKRRMTILYSGRIGRTDSLLIRYN